MTIQPDRHQLLRQRWAADDEAKGKAKGKAKTLLRVLDHRGIDVDEQTRERITSCTVSATIDLWIDRALDASSTDDLFDSTRKR